MAHDDFAFEHRPGIPAPLPSGERVLWQGSPDWRTLALRPFHVRKVALWFLAIALFELVWTLVHGRPLGAALPGLLRTVLLGAVAVGILGLLAWLNGRVTIYTITTRRILIRFGVALEITMNLPFAEIKEANLRVGPSGIGDIPIRLHDTRRVGYVVLWPHVRPWRLARPEPMLRAVPNVAHVGALLGAAIAEAAVDDSAEVRTSTAAAPPHTAPASGVASGESATRDDGARTTTNVVAEAT